MAKLQIEIERPDGWRRLTTIHVDDNGRRDDQTAWARARDNAAMQLRSWRDYFGTGEKLRVVELEGW